MLGTRKFRISERLEARLASQSEDGLVLTTEDEANLESFAKKLQDAINLLREEVDAIRNGKLNIVSELFDRKAAVLKWLELRLPVIEPFLKHDAAQPYELQQSLAELKKVVAEDSELLARMSTAARSIVREIEKATDRNGLTGLYGKSGQKIGSGPGGEMRLDREY